MMLFFVVSCIVALLVCLGYVVWMDEMLYREPNIPEFDSERKVREIKLRLADLEWKFNREMDKYK
tara:strand:+ start:635 stop:829 length:195 start_codon:yes stop_codon:yes gene_type:complete